MERNKEVFYTAFACIFVFLVGFIVYRLVNPFSESHPLNADKLWTVVQNWRTKNHLPLFKKDLYLCSIAVERMSQIKKDFSHDGFNKLDFSKTSYRELGENLSQVGKTEEATLTAWLNSPGHRENLEKNYNYSCVVTDGSYAVQIFGKY